MVVMRVIINTRNETHFIIMQDGKEIGRIAKSKNTLESIIEIIGKENILLVI